MRIALTGVSGFIGAHIAKHAVEHGHQVTGLVRATSKREHIAPFVDRFVVGDQAHEGAWPELFEGADAVVHNSMDWQAMRSGDLREHLSKNLDASLAFLAASRPRPFVFISSVAVHHDIRPRWQGQVDEDHPLRPSSLYGACKAAIEAHLWSEHYSGGHGVDGAPRHVVSIRPAAVYGPVMAPGHRSWCDDIFESIKQGEPFEREGGGKFVHVADVAEAVVRSLETPDASPHPFNLADCYARWSDIAVFAAEALGADASIKHVSPTSPENMFTHDAAKTTLGVPLDRGHQGLREHMRHLASQTAAGASA